MLIHPEDGRRSAASYDHRYNYTFFDRLKIDPKEHKIMLTEAAMNPKKVPSPRPPPPTPAARHRKPAEGDAARPLSLARAATHPECIDAPTRTPDLRGRPPRCKGPSPPLPSPSLCTDAIG